MKAIALLPVKDEAWVLPHALASLSAFCDVVIVADQNSSDRSREVCRGFPKVVLIESAESRTCTRARWQLLDAARDYDGCNLLWSTDADELVSPSAAAAFIDARRADLTPGTLVQCQYIHSWNSFAEYRVWDVKYGPQWKELAFVDDRRMDWDRANLLSLHEPRVPIDGAAKTVRGEDLAVLHLQWLMARRTQSRQAWYRCREWLDGRSARDINERYAATLPTTAARTAPVPAAWLGDLTLPDLAADRDEPWTDRDLRRWFDEYGPEHFEPLEIWHIAPLREAFVRTTGRQPRPDRSYRPRWTARAGHFARRMAAGARRRLPF
ncbi:MAG TPA: glycosyltransferase family A protein [Vicinamibacterales bacterium]|nr:glycosyltransferase family A protein [Vicinamibacterales bacterium]